ncbi:hypothetical protein EE612_055484 [Oryza sativa]|nr:hypothetical protein EE612_055484 [Oryza sativa]
MEIDTLEYSQVKCYICIFCALADSICNVKKYQQHGTHMVFVIVDDADAMDQVLQVNGGHNHNAFPFDLNFDADEEDLQMHPDMQEYGVYVGDVEVVFEQEELDDSDQEDEQQNKNLTKIQRQQIYAALAGKTNNGTLRKNATTEVAAMFNVKRARVQAIW